VPDFAERFQFPNVNLQRGVVCFKIVDIHFCCVNEIDFVFKQYLDFSLYSNKIDKA